MTDEYDSGWSIVANEDEGASVIAGILTLETDTEYARSTLAEASGVPLKTLYLAEIFDFLEKAGMIDRVDDPEAETEASYTINDDNAVYQAAMEFDEAFAESLAAQ